MNENCRTTLGDMIFRDIENNEYLNELYESILYNYSMQLFKMKQDSLKEINIEHALRFADLLSKSTDEENADSHRIWAQEIVALLQQLYPMDNRVDYYLGSVLSNTGNYYGMSKVVPEYESKSMLERLFTNFSKDYMSIPAEPEHQFLHSQKTVYNHLTDPYFSYSAPTSMGKSFIMRMFIKKQIMDGKKLNFALLVPTKALINEVNSKIINDLKELLAEYNYRLVTSAGALVLKQNHNFIFVLTPERLLYLLIGNKNIKVDYLFVDEAHKISSKDARSTFYYKVVDMLSQQNLRPHIIFASPNIPNPEVYLKLIPDVHEITEYKMSSDFSPVSQVKYLIDTVEGNIRLYNSYKRTFSYIGKITDMMKLEDIIHRVRNKKTQNIVYCSSTANAIENARNYAEKMQEMGLEELNILSKDIQNEVHGDYYLASLIKKGVAYHIGYLPSTIRMRIEEAFGTGIITTIFCTSTLVEGVNLPADNLFITSYKNGSSYMTPVDFKNLIGRVGRIDFGLYGNVYLVRTANTVENKKYEELLQEKVPEQKLSLVTELTKGQKKTIIKFLLEGNIELPKYPKNQSADNYSLMRKFALILLRDIQKGRDSIVKKEFESFLKANDEKMIKDAFSYDIKQPDDDINISVDQTNNLYRAIAGGLQYPKIYENGSIDYEELMVFLEKLCRIFKWEKYELQTLGKKNKSDGSHAMLKWYAVILVQWIQGTGLSNIMNKAIEYKEQHPKSSIQVNGELINYDGSLKHKNIVIAETLRVIENTILFSISNYFLRFSEEYKKFHKVDNFPNDWYEYVEYGTINPLTIMLQRSGFSREASTYIKANRDKYVTGSIEEPKLKRCILQCNSASVCKEAYDIQYNIPELFID
ncbi:DEAD/DEAH box helicase [Lacrimispora celerecrescens]|uniref:DEAD/DEAH box helicase n=1 Tax=Lacrimispora celerecrescens TaxID=29354 RepID=UPI001646A9AE|nr:DEAD/DEAH box helicase [Lacrimispora celerecrescens]